ncbi:S-layer homology domain-containing protein [Paenibacillus nicotianae]|uniref:S-layer homology domain-containing protein n=2 Tax=Paenibacillus nicotianae TaxID=1526551 RepID=A0ABW4UY46_9BACL
MNKTYILLGELMLGNMKKKNRQWMMLLLSVAIALPAWGLTATKSAQASDIQNHWAKDVLTQWQNKGYISGFQDGSLQPDQSVTRSQLAAMINKSFGFTQAGSIAYQDVKPSDWFYHDIAIAKSQGYMEGYKNNTFHPNQKVTRQELAVILTSLKKLKSSSSAVRMKDTANSPSWSKGSIGAVIDNGLMNGDEKGFRPKDTTTRAEAVTVLERSLESSNSTNTSKSNSPTTTYNTAGVYGPASGQQQITGDMQLNSAGSTLRNMVIEGDLLLGAGIGEGDALLDHVTVKGTTTINGGGINSIHLQDSTLHTTVINKKDGNVRVVTTGTTTVQQMILQSGGLLEEQGLTTGSGFTNVILSNQIPAGSTVSLKGRIDSMDISSSSVLTQLLTGSVDNLAVASGTTDNKISTTTSSSIQSLTLNGVAKVSGNGTIEKAYINVAGTTITPRVNQTTTSAGVTARIEGGIVGGEQAVTNIRKDDNKHPESSTPVVVQQPVQSLDVKNGQAILHLNQPTNELLLSDMEVTATLNGKPYTLTNVIYDSVTGVIQFNPLNLKAKYNKILEITVKPSSSSSRLLSISKGDLRFNGFTGFIGEEQGEPVVGMTIHFRRGLNVTDGPIVATVTTNENGSYNVTLPPGVYTGELKKDGFIPSYLMATSLAEEYNYDQSAIVSRMPTEGKISIVLTWDELPYDEDAHLLGPTPDGYGFHTSTDNRQYNYQNQNYVSLDTDNMSSYGPEVITINKRVDGIYTFYVQNYSATANNGEASTLRKSSATVKVYNGAYRLPMKTYHIPVGDGEEPYWHVFDMNVDRDQISFFDQNMLVNKPPISIYHQTPDQGDLDMLDLEREMELISSYSELSYDTKVDEDISLRLSNSINSNINTFVSDIELLPHIMDGHPVGVTDDTYLTTSDTEDTIRLAQYNGSAYAADYNVTLHLSLGEADLEMTVLVKVPTIDTWIEQASVEAQSKINTATAGQDITALQNALDRKNALTSSSTIEEKIAVLEKLNQALNTF